MNLVAAGRFSLALAGSPLGKPVGSSSLWESEAACARRQRAQGRARSWIECNNVRAESIGINTRHSYKDEARAHAAIPTTTVTG